MLWMQNLTHTCHLFPDIQIGFENTVYTVEEGASLESQVFITKFDGFSTEEDIDIQISAIPQNAQLGKPRTTEP